MASSRGRSKAHEHLETILQVIASCRRRSSSAEHANPSVERLEYSHSKLLTVGVEDFLPNLTPQGDAERLDQKECDPTEAEAVPSKTHLSCVVVEEEEKEISEVLNLPRGKVTNISSPPYYCSARVHEEVANRDPATLSEEEDETEQPKRGGYGLHLLVEAARLLEPGFGEDEESELPGSDRDSRKRAAAAKRRRRDWAAAYLGAFDEDIAPVVRSKRGRNQVLPSRYRDSVMEPWKAAARPSRRLVLSDPKR